MTIALALITLVAIAEAAGLVRLRAANRRLLDAVIDQTLDLAEIAEENARLRSPTDAWGT